VTDIIIKKKLKNRRLMKIIAKLFLIALFVIFCEIGMQADFSVSEGFAMELDIRSSVFEEG
jgi:hypothetical protein